MSHAPQDDVVSLLVAERARFLGFLEKRVGSRAAAEEILQDGFVKALKHAADVRDEERAVAWFYRILRNAVADWHARRAAERSRDGGDVALLKDDLADEPEVAAEICRCVLELSRSLKPEYAEALRTVDVDERPIADLAQAAGITPNNARVRLFRAREALRERVSQTCRACATHGCIDCTCS